MINDKIKKYNIENNIIFENYTTEPQVWFQKIGFILSVSDIEGSHQAVAEGMATGTIPIIYGNALKKYRLDEIYPKNFCFYDNTINNLCNKIVLYQKDNLIFNNDSIFCKDFSKNFKLDVIGNQILKIIK